ncbi:hypothetical protein BDR06DRAFT_971678 [Suillus hirtellus]|nr:hypothetical protein BDR06DRAFT_971678 [Suillus hirtellus]
MYQLFSSKNWTNVLYSTAIAEISLGQVVIMIIFLCLWLIFANFIVMQMFIAVIHENFSVAEETKKSRSIHIKVEKLPLNLVLPMQKTLVQDYEVQQSIFDMAIDLEENTRRDQGTGWMPLSLRLAMFEESVTIERRMKEEEDAVGRGCIQQGHVAATQFGYWFEKPIPLKGILMMCHWRTYDRAISSTKQRDRMLSVGNGSNTTENDHDEHSKQKAQKAGPLCLEQSFTFYNTLLQQLPILDAYSF